MSNIELSKILEVSLTCLGIGVRLVLLVNLGHVPAGDLSDDANNAASAVLERQS